MTVYLKNVYTNKVRSVYVYADYSCQNFKAKFNGDICSPPTKGTKTITLNGFNYKAVRV